MTAPLNEVRIVPAVAAEWLDRWDSQQEGYVADREERFAVLADIVAAALADDGLAALGTAVGTGRAARAGVAGREGWADWWDAALHDERLSAIAAGRARPRAASASAEDASTPDTGSSGGPRSSDGPGGDAGAEAEHHHGSNRLSITDHVELLRAAGYSAAAPLWQVGEDQIVVARR